MKHFIKRFAVISCALCLFLSFLSGCGQNSPEAYKFKLPDNAGLALDAGKEDFIKAGGLTESDGAYLKEGGATINGVNFDYVSYSFEEEQFSHAAYFSRQSDQYEEEGQKIISFLNEIYGPSQEHEDKDGYWVFTLENGEKYSISVDIQSDTRYVFLFVYHFKK